MRPAQPTRPQMFETRDDLDASIAVNDMERLLIINEQGAREIFWYKETDCTICFCEGRKSCFQ